MPEPKTKPTDASVPDFLDGISDESRRRDCWAVTDLMRQATGAEPVMWGHAIVGFGRCRQRYASGREGEWPVIAFSPRKADVTLYIMPGFDRYEDLMGRLGKHKTGKACLYLKRLSDVDLAVLRELIEASVRDRSRHRVDG